MGSSMDEVDEAMPTTSSFKIINFSSEGLLNLRLKLNTKLKEFMGDYTDDTLVDYVIVLLRNGKRKAEAINELHVFLGDDTLPFISWLWDHLASNFNLYALPQPSPSINNHSASDRGNSNHNLTKRRRHTDWKQPLTNQTDTPPLLTSVIHLSQPKEKTHHEPKHATTTSPSPGSSLQRNKSFRHDTHHHNRETALEVTAKVPRRLLQFAVRDALGSLRSSNSVNEPSLKRLRSVVSTPASYSPVVEQPPRIQSVASVPNPMSTVIKAVADAAEDVKTLKSSRSVFDRLGPDSIDFPEIADSRRDEHLDYDHIGEEVQSPYLERSNNSGADMTMLETETQQPYYFISDKSYDDADDMDSRFMNASRTGTYAENRDDGIMQEQPAVMANKPRNRMNSSPHVPAIGKSGVQLMKDNRTVAPVVNGNAKHVTDVQKESQKMLQSASGTSTGRPLLEDADSRTIFVSNVIIQAVHFAATKDLLSRHFNKFGEVLRVVIVTDAATRQPKGSAYVEFARNEAADNALSFDGTSFMSRIVKVVKRRGAAHQEAASVPAWPRVARGSPYGGGRFLRGAFPRGAFRGRGLPMKAGARSLQWKRDSTEGLPGNSVPSPTARSLTYVRTEAKPRGDPSS
ncbi:hypothetical protein ACFE04_004203 [Oxalis oulophora]